MILRRSVLAILLILIGPVTAVAAGACRNVEHLGMLYTVCSFDPAVSGIRIFDKDRNGAAYGSFRALEDDLRRDREYIRFAVNGGMYHDDRSPVGLFIADGVEHQPISIKPGWGNFHLLPNGVFYVERGRAGVLETKAYLASGIKPRFASQSGPMLVIDGKIHPAFLPHSDSFKIRNGVGIGRDGRVHFAISEGPVRFYDFATLYRDVLDCGNALFLDGTISSLYAPELKRQDSVFPLGPIIAVVATMKE